MPKKPLKKKASDFSSIRKKFSSSDRYKEQKYFDLGEAFQKATGIPGPAMGQINMLLGHSDTGKNHRPNQNCGGCTEKRYFTCIHHYRTKI